MTRFANSLWMIWVKLEEEQPTFLSELNPWFCPSAETIQNRTGTGKHTDKTAWNMCISISKMTQKTSRSEDWEEMIMACVLHAWLLARHPQHPIAPRVGLHVWHTGSQAHTSYSRSSTKPGSCRGSSMASTISTSKPRWRLIGARRSRRPSQQKRRWVWPGSRSEQILVMSTKRRGGWRSC